MRKDFRRVHLPDGIWQYRVGEWTILLYSPVGARHLTTVNQIRDLSESCHWQPAIGPDDIAAWIEKELRS
jgi:hypothetical protein